MANARKEFETKTEGHTVLCAWIQIDSNDVDVDAILRKRYSKSEYDEFLKEIDVEYDPEWGLQELDGEIWLDDGQWFNRYEYDGREHWTRHILPMSRNRPKIPEECGGEDSVVKAASKA